MCNYVIARNPPNQPTSERAIPVAIFRWERLSGWDGMQLACAVGLRSGVAVQQYYAVPAEPACMPLPTACQIDAGCFPAVPPVLSSTEPSVARTYLRKWCGDIGQGEYGGGETHAYSSLVAMGGLPKQRLLLPWRITSSPSLCEPLRPGPGATTPSSSCA